MKKVSIMMPVYNGLPLIKASVESILKQTYTNWECIIVDDGSTDGTSAYLDSLSDSRFVVHHFAKNQGRPTARQKALELTTGEYVTMLDAEDLMSPDRLEEQVECLEKNPNIALVSSRMCSFGTHTDLIKARGVSTVTTTTFDGKRCPIHAASMLRGDKARLLKYNPMMKLSQDVDFLERYLKGESFMELPFIHYYYTEYDSVSKRKIRRSYKLNCKKYFKMRRFSPCFTYILKYIYSVAIYPFVSIESILSKRGVDLNQEERMHFEQDCLSIVRKYCS